MNHINFFSNRMNLKHYELTKKEVVEEEDVVVQEATNPEPEVIEEKKSDSEDKPLSSDAVLDFFIQQHMQPISIKGAEPSGTDDTVQEDTPVTSVSDEIEENETVEYLPTSAEDIDVLYEEMSYKYIPPALRDDKPMAYSDQRLYKNLDRMSKSDNKVVQQFANMIKEAVDKLQLGDNEAVALINRIMTRIENGFSAVHAQKNKSANLFAAPEKEFLKNLDVNGNGSFFDELETIINEETAKVKVIPQSEIDAAQKINVDALPKGQNGQIDGSAGQYIYDNLNNFLLSEDPALRKFANVIMDSFDKFSASNEDEKVKLINKIIDIVKEEAKRNAKNINDLSAISKGALSKDAVSNFVNALNLLDKNDGSIFDELEDIINSGELERRFNSQYEEFWDTDSFFEYANSMLATNAEEAAQKRDSFTYEEIFELAQNEEWNENNDWIFASIWRNIDEIDTNKDGVISYDEMKAVIGEKGFSAEFTKTSDNFISNIYKLDKEAAEEYAKLTPQEKLEKVIEEAIRYCKMKGMDDYVEILTGHGGHWKISVGKTHSDDAAGTCYVGDHLIRIKPEYIENASFYDVVGVLMHEVTHAVIQELSSISQENYCDQVKEDFLDTVGRGYYKADEEAEKIDEENSNSELYKDLPRERGKAGKIFSDILAGAADVYNWIKGWF